MNPIFLAVILVQVARAIQSGRKAGGASPSGGGFDAFIGTWGVFVWMVLVPFGLALTLLLFTGQVWAVLPVAAIALVAFPWPITRLVLIPLGQARLAYWLTFTSDVIFHLDRRGGAAVAAAWALAMRPKLDEETADWVAGQLAVESPLRGAGALASGLLLAARGDRDGARALLETVESVDARACPAAVRRIANGWLASDAAERGEWARVGALGATLGRGGRLGWLLSAIGQSLQLEPMSPGKLGLWLRWALAPHRAATRPMVERAVAALDGAFIHPEEEPPPAPIAPPVTGDALGTALSLHALVLSRPRDAVRPDDVRAVGQAWDAVLFDRATEHRLLERALVLGASGAASTLERLRASIEEDLVAVVLAAGMPLKELGEGGQVGARVRLRLRDGLLSEVEAASDALRRRVDERRELPAMDEWREWANLTARYARGVASAGDDFRRLSFAKVYPDACSYAVWLFNDRKQRPLGNVIFRWLLAEAEALDDARAITLQTKNVACGV
jgi:hypothetical protein